MMANAQPHYLTEDTSDYSFQPALLEPLSERELEIIALIGEGYSNREIADALYLSLNTVKWYNKQIFEKLAVSNRTEAAVRSRSLGLLDSDSPDNQPSPAPNETPYKIPFYTFITPFVGREAELNDLSDMLDNPEFRLITLVGSGGSGKTRLAIETAQRHKSQFADRAYFVCLTSVACSANLVPGIADEIGFTFQQNGQPLQQQLLDYMSDREMLLVIDNFEPVLDGAPLIAEIMNYAPNVRLLITSRERLNLYGETVYSVGAIDTAHQCDTTSDAIRLFELSGQRARPGFQIDATNSAHAAEICCLVNGHPLAIELAAGWLDTLPLEHIAQEMRRGIDILESDMPNLPERHRSIRMMFDQTWGSLTAEERAAMMSLSVFHGGFTAETAGIVAAVNVRLLRRLVNKSLIEFWPNGAYEIGNLMRQYSAEKLVESGLYDTAHTRHAEYFAQLLYDAQPLSDHVNLSTLHKFELNYNNLTAAWRWMVQTRNLSGLKKAHHNLTWFMKLRGYIHECIELLESAFAMLRTLPPLTLYGEMALNLGLLHMASNHKTAETYFLLAISMLEHTEPSPALACAYARLGMASASLGLSTEQTTYALQKSYEISKALGDVRHQAEAARCLARLRFELGEYDRAIELSREALRLLEGGGNRGQASIDIYTQMGWSATALNQFDAAQAYFNSALQLAETSGWVEWITQSRINLCQLYIKQDDFTRARQEIVGLIGWRDQHGQEWQLLRVLVEAVAEHWLIPLGEYSRAVEILACVLHHPLVVPNVQRKATALLTQIQAQLPADHYTAAVQHGQTQPLSTLISNLRHELAQAA